MTYNHYFTTTLQKQRQRKHQKIVEKAKKASEAVIYYSNSNHTHYDPIKMEKAMADPLSKTWTSTPQRRLWIINAHTIG